MKLLLMLVFIVVCFVLFVLEGIVFLEVFFELEIGIFVFMVGLVYVIYLFFGWNVVVYIVEEIRMFVVNFFKVFIFGMLVVSLFYVLL